jgi:hypothetical protein
MPPRKRSKAQALREVLSAIEGGTELEGDSRGQVYRQEFGEAFVAMIREALGPEVEPPAVGGEADKERAILELLRRRHMPPEWAHWAELRLGTGYGRGVEQRWDFAAINLYPSKGLSLVVYEVKVSRSDFLRELSKPKKRAAAEKAATECWFAMPCGTAKVDEIPEGWGLVELTKGGLRRKKAARQRERPPLGENLVLSIARRSSEEPPELPEALWHVAGEPQTLGELTERVKDIYDGLLKGAETRTRREVERETRQEVRRLQMLEQDVRRVCGADPWKDRETSTGTLLQRWLQDSERQPKLPPARKNRLVANAEALLEFVKEL